MHVAAEAQLQPNVVLLNDFTKLFFDVYDMPKPIWLPRQKRPQLQI